jgi:hypothetical protein
LNMDDGRYTAGWGTFDDRAAVARPARYLSHALA